MIRSSFSVDKVPSGITEVNEKRVMVVTTLNAINYGAVLQAYAFHTFLNECEIDNYFLNRERSHSVYFAKITRNANIFKQLFQLSLRLLYLPQIRRKVLRFGDFIEKNIAVSHTYLSDQDIRDNPPQADLYITGGDQMFNVSNGICYANFLDFGSQTIKRGSFSTSLGIPEVPQQYMDEFRRLLKRYDSLSLREAEAAEYVSTLCNVPCTTNMDPVFLLSKEQWSQIAAKKSRKTSGKYILVYELLHNSGVNSAVIRLTEMTGLPVIIISNNARNYVKGGKVFRDAGPTEFVRYFRDAEYVITTSYHGTCFSVIFEKKFFSLIRAHGEVRINSLLAKLGLKDRIISDASGITTDEVCYSTSREIIAEERDNATEYIRGFINE